MSSPVSDSSITSSVETALSSFRSIDFSELSLTVFELTLLAASEAANALPPATTRKTAIVDMTFA
jgi:hypothetical protein